MDSDGGVAALVEEIRAAQLPSPTVRRRIREAAGVTRREAAEALGVHPLTVLRWETGEVEPSRSHALAYRQLLDALEEVAGR